MFRKKIGDVLAFPEGAGIMGAAGIGVVFGGTGERLQQVERGFRWADIIPESD